MLWITAALLICSTESRYLQPTLQDSYIQSLAVEDTYCLENQYNRQLNNEEEAVIYYRGDEICTRSQPKEFYYFGKQVCLLKDDGHEPKHPYELCRDFNNLPNKNIIVLTSQQLADLRSDIKRNTGVNSPHKGTFYTDGTYNFVECKKFDDIYKWHSGYYLPYNLRKYQGNYVIGKVYTPVKSRPSFYNLLRSQ